MRHAKDTVHGIEQRQATSLGAIRGAFATRGTSSGVDGSSAPSSRAPKLILLTALALLAALALGVAFAGADTAPTPTIAAPTNVGYTLAHLSGAVNPNGGPSITHWRFEYSTDQSNWSQAPEHALSQTESEESTPISVSEDLAAGTLQAGTKYFVRLAASNVGGENQSSEEELTTKAVAKPSVTTPVISAITVSGAHLAAEVNPNSPEPEASTSADEKAVFQTSWHFDCNPACNNSGGGSLAADNAAHQVSADASGLEPHKTYTVTVHASNAGGTTEESTTFTTGGLPRLLSPQTSFDPGPGEAVLRAFVNPRNDALATCRFDYGPDEHYGQSVSCDSLPPVNDEADEVEAHLSGLTAGAIYHYRFFARNGAGSSTTEDGSFEVLQAPGEESCPNEARRTEQHATYLPDCRAYEQVSPVDKSGADVLLTNERTRVAADGNAYGFASLGGFAETKEVGVATDYLSERSPSPEPGDGGWTTHGINPIQGTLNFDAVAAGEEPLYEGVFSADLEKGVFYAPHALGADPGTSQVPNLYLRSDLRSRGAGAYQLLTACPLCEEPGGEPLSPITIHGLGRSFARPLLAAASPDFAHVVFNSMRALTADAPPQLPSCSLTSLNFFLNAYCSYRLYESEAAAVRLVGRVPPSTAASCNDETGPSCIPADASFAGANPGASEGGRAVGAGDVSDGSDGHTRVFFTQPTDEAGQTVSEVSFPFPILINRSAAGRLFVRLDGRETIQLDVSERAQPGSFAPAEFLAASADGQRAFFRTSQALTEDAPLGGGQKLYMWRATPDSEGNHLTLISRGREPAGGTTDGALGIIGISENGRYVYFVSRDQLVRGAPLSASHPHSWIYLWHDGQLSLVGPAPALGDQDALHELMATGYPSALSPQQARVSPDGRTLLFSAFSGEGLTGYDHGGCLTHFYAGGACRELYVYSAGGSTPLSPALACASCNPSGAPAVGMATDGLGDNLTGATRSDLPHTLPLSADGRYVFFSSPDNLLPEDTNSKYDAYEYDTKTGRLHLLSSGTSESDSYFVNADPSGHNAFILTNQPLLGWDTDGAYDVYDVRIGGGFPEPRPVHALCDGESCQGTQTPSPTPAPVGSGLEGPGNPKSHRCPKGKHSVKSHGKTRCVSRRHHKHHKRSRSRTSVNSGGQK